MIAVKVFNLQQKGAAKSFMDECESLRMIRHRNLTRVLTCASVDRVLTCCAGVDHEGEERKLSLLQRLNIAVDVALALKYLHHESSFCIIHRILKPSNVLLDNDMVAHVSDFGLAKLLSGSLEKLSKKQSSSIAVKGSIDYVPPEYGLGGNASTTGDVYSYGILLLEIFTARRPSDMMFRDGLNLRRFAEMALQNHVMGIVDPALSVADEETQQFF